MTSVPAPAPAPALAPARSGEHMDALVDALREGSIGGAGLDVTAVEPLPDGHPFYSLDNVLMSNHSSGWSVQQLARRHELIAANLDRLARAQPLRSVVVAARRRPS